MLDVVLSYNLVQYQGKLKMKVVYNMRVLKYFATWDIFSSGGIQTF